MPSSVTHEYRPPKTALALLVLIALALSLPAAIAVAVVIEGRETVSAMVFSRVLVFVGPVSIVIAVSMYRQHIIRLGDGIAEFAFTRFCLPRTVALSKETVRIATLERGILALDGRPRPIVEYELRTGERGWIPFAIYRGKTIDALMADLKAMGIRIVERPS